MHYDFRDDYRQVQGVLKKYEIKRKKIIHIFEFSKSRTNLEPVIIIPNFSRGMGLCYDHCATKNKFKKKSILFSMVVILKETGGPYFGPTLFLMDGKN